MKRTDLIQKCADYVPGWDLYKKGITPPDGFGVFRIADIENNFPDKSQTAEHWNKTYFRNLINDTIDQVNIDFSNFMSDYSFVIHSDGIVIFNRENKVVGVVDNKDGILITDKEEILMKYFQIIEGHCEKI